MTSQTQLMHGGEEIANGQKGLYSGRYDGKYLLSESLAAQMRRETARIPLIMRRWLIRSNVPRGSSVAARRSCRN